MRGAPMPLMINGHAPMYSQRRGYGGGTSTLRRFDRTVDGHPASSLPFSTQGRKLSDRRKYNVGGGGGRAKGARHGASRSPRGKSPRRSYYDAWKKLQDTDSRGAAAARGDGFEVQRNRKFPAATLTVKPRLVRQSGNARKIATAYARQREVATASALAAVNRWATDASKRRQNYVGAARDDASLPPPTTSVWTVQRQKFTRGAIVPESPEVSPSSQCAVSGLDAQRRITESLRRNAAGSWESRSHLRVPAGRVNVVRRSAHAGDRAIPRECASSAAWVDSPPSATAAEEDDDPEDEEVDDDIPPPPHSPISPAPHQMDDLQDQLRGDAIVRSTTAMKKTKKKKKKRKKKVKKKINSSPRGKKNRPEQKDSLRAETRVLTQQRQLRPEQSIERDASSSPHSNDLKLLSDDGDMCDPVVNGASCHSKSAVSGDSMTKHNMIRGDDEKSITNAATVACAPAEGRTNISASISGCAEERCADVYENECTDSDEDDDGADNGNAGDNDSCGGDDHEEKKHDGAVVVAKKTREGETLILPRQTCSGNQQSEGSSVVMCRPRSVSPRRRNESSTHVVSAADGQKLARKRVLLRMKEKSRAKEEEHLAREKVRAERENRAKERIAHKVQQRAEIYALNAIMRNWNVRQRSLYLAQQRAAAALNGAESTSSRPVVRDDDGATAQVANSMQDRSVLSV